MLEFIRKGFLVTSLLLISLAAYAGNLYRWMDENGRVQISDKIPPAATQRGYDIITPQGRLIKHVPPPMTDEEIAAIAAKQAEEQEKIRARKEQERKDRILLLTYGTVDEIEFTRNERLSLIEAQMKLHEKRLREKDAELAAVNKRTQKFTDEDKPVPDRFLEQERRLMEEQQALMEMISIGESQYQKLNERFLNDIQRFKQLQKEKAQAR